MKYIKYILFGLLFPALSMAQPGAYRAPSNATHNPSASPFLSTNANWHTAVGDSAGYTMVSGSYGTFVGHSAGYSFNNDSDMTIIGSFAAYKCTTGIDNVIIGARAGYRSSGSDLVIVGNMAGYHNTSGNDLVFIGEDAGYRNTTGTDLVFIGEDAGYNNSSGIDNTFIGNAAGRQNKTGYRNTAVGNEALFDLGGSINSDAHHNTAVGDSCLIDNGVGIYNTALGAAAGAATENGNFNTFIGARAGYDNNRTNSQNGVAAHRNTFLGYRCGYYKREGSDNVGMGANAGMRGFANNINRVRERTTFIGSGSFVWADDAVTLGYQTNARKQYSIAIGSEANSDGINSIAIGYQSSVLEDNAVVIGNAAVQSIGGSVNWTATSDGRYKTGVEENIPGLKFVDRLRPVSYHYDLQKLHEASGFAVDSVAHLFPDKEKVRYSGFIAQEVEQAAEDVGYDFSGVDAPPDKNGKYGLRYAEFTVPMVKAIQELHKKVKSQEQIIQDQKNELLAYQTLFEKLESRVTELEVTQHISSKSNEIVNQQ